MIRIFDANNKIDPQTVAKIRSVANAPSVLASIDKSSLSRKAEPVFQAPFKAIGV